MCEYDRFYVCTSPCAAPLLSTGEASEHSVDIIHCRRSPGIVIGVNIRVSKILGSDYSLMETLTSSSGSRTNSCNGEEMVIV